jgi:hypothetical protein
MKTSSNAVRTRMDHLAVRQELQAQKKLINYHLELGGGFCKVFLVWDPPHRKHFNTYRCCIEFNKIG